MAKKSRTREARKRRQQQQRQNKQRLIIVGIVIVAVLAIALVIVSNQPVEAVIPAGLDERYDDLDRSLSQEGYPRIGDPDAPVTVREYASFSCPGCEAFHDSSFESILDRVRVGQVLFVYVPLQTGSIPNAQGAARAGLCAGQQGRFWEMHDVLFAWHTQYVNTAFSQNRLLAGADALGLDGGTFTNCFNSQSITTVLESAQGEGVSSTPTIEVNGVIAQSSQGGIPSTQDVLNAIDSVTPRDWSPTAAEDTDAQDVDAEEVTDAEDSEEDAEDIDMEATEEAEAQDAEEESTESEEADTEDADDEASEDVDVEATDDEDEETSETDTEEAESTEEAED